MWYTYWIIIFLVVVGITAAAIKKTSVRNYVYMIVGHLRYNNNAPWWALLILIAIFGVSALLAGFGKPLLARSSRDAKTVLIEKASQNSGAVEFLKSLWRGTNAPPASVPVPSAGKTPEKSYPSWWHWIIVIVLVLAWVIYTPFAWSDETKGRIAKILKKLKRRAVLDNIQTSFGSSPAVSGATPTTDGSFWKRIFREKGFTFHSIIEIIWEVLPRWLGIK